MPDRTELANTLAWLREVYQHRFVPTPTTAAVWSQVLSELNPGELTLALKRWADSNPEWPPTPLQLRNLVPRFCRCGSCGPCIARAIDHHAQALANGSIGAEMPSRLSPRPPERHARLLGAPRIDEDHQT